MNLRHFGPKGKAGGGAPVAPAYKPPEPILTNFESLVKEKGIESFMFGPPHGITKMHNSHRNYIVPKLASKMEFFAKKMRE